MELSTYEKAKALQEQIDQVKKKREEIVNIQRRPGDAEFNRLLNIAHEDVVTLQAMLELSFIQLK